MHGVVDRERRGHAAAGGIDVEMNVLASIFALKVEQFHDDIIRVGVMNLALQEYNSILQQEITKRELPLTLVGLVGVATENLVGRVVAGDWKIHAESFSVLIDLGFDVLKLVFSKRVRHLLKAIDSLAGTPRVSACQNDGQRPRTTSARSVTTTTRPVVFAIPLTLARPESP